MSTTWRIVERSPDGVIFNLSHCSDAGVMARKHRASVIASVPCVLEPS
jgi:hypothetical protein